MFINELKREYHRLVKLEMSMLKRRITLENAWSAFSKELGKAENNNNTTDEELEQLYVKNDKFAYVVDIARHRESSIGKLLDKMASIINTYDEYERRRNGRA